MWTAIGKSSKRLGNISSKTTIKKALTSSKSVKKVPKAFGKSTKRLGKASSKTTVNKAITS